MLTEKYVSDTVDSTLTAPIKTVSFQLPEESFGVNRWFSRAFFLQVKWDFNDPENFHISSQWVF